MVFPALLLCFLESRKLNLSSSPNLTAFLALHQLYSVILTPVSANQLNYSTTNGPGFCSMILRLKHVPFWLHRIIQTVMAWGITD